MEIKFKNFTLTSDKIAIVYSIVMTLTALSLMFFKVAYGAKTSNFLIGGIFILALNAKKIFKIN